MRYGRFQNMSKIPPIVGLKVDVQSGLSHTAFASSLSSPLNLVPSCHHANTATCSCLQERPVDWVRPLCLDAVSVDFSSPSNGVFLTLLGISTTQLQHVVLHYPGTSSPSPLRLPCWFLVSKIKEKYCSNHRWRNKAGYLWCQAAEVWSVALLLRQMQFAAVDVEPR